jgi:hypothetical protein
MTDLNRALIKGAAARAEPHDTDVAGNEAHQQKNKGGRPEEGRDYQQ